MNGYCQSVEILQGIHCVEKKLSNVLLKYITGKYYGGKHE